MLLAQLNIGLPTAPLTEPELAGFVEALEPVNALADAASGFVWRLQTEDGDATAIRPYDDDRSGPAAVHRSRRPGSPSCHISNRHATSANSGPLRPGASPGPVARLTLRPVAKDEPSWLPLSCSGCGQRWYGIDRAHCASCHRTFGGTELFDQHRSDDACVNPVGLGMVKHQKSAIWELRPPAAPRRRAG